MAFFGFGKKEKDKMKTGLEKTRTGFWGSIMNTLTGSVIRVIKLLFQLCHTERQFFFRPRQADITVQLLTQRPETDNQFTFRHGLLHIEKLAPKGHDYASCPDTNSSASASSISGADGIMVISRAGSPVGTQFFG